jgi:WD40 repeat protein
MSGKLSVCIAAALTSAGILQPLPAVAPGAPGILWSVDWSQDGNQFAVGGDWGVGLFDAKTFEQRHSPMLDGAKKGTQVRWHPQLNLLAVSGGADSVTAIYNTDTHRHFPMETKEGTRAIAWNSTGKLLATAGNDGSLQIWSDEGKLLHTTRQENAKGMTGVAWHPARNNVLMIGEFISLHGESGSVIKQVRHRPGAKGFCLLLCVEWHPSGEFFVTGDYGNHDTGDLPVLQFWSPDLQLLKTITTASDAPIRNINWNRDGSLLASASDTLRVWSKDGEPLHVGKSPDHLWGVHWNPAGDRLLTSSMEGHVTLWNGSAVVLKKDLQMSEH